MSCALRLFLAVIVVCIATSPLGAQGGVFCAKRESHAVPTPEHIIVDYATHDYAGCRSWGGQRHGWTVFCIALNNRPSQLTWFAISRGGRQWAFQDVTCPFDQNGWALAQIVDVDLDSTSRPKRNQRLIYKQPGSLKPRAGLNGTFSSSGSVSSLFCRPRSNRYGQDSENSLREVYPPLRDCQCYGFFRSLSHAHLLAGVGFFSILGAGAFGFIWLGLISISAQRLWLGSTGVLIGIGVWVFIGWAALQMGNCHPLARCDGGQYAAT